MWQPRAIFINPALLRLPSAGLKWKRSNVIGDFVAVRTKWKSQTIDG